ncbi:hypothetical protein BJ741DRAFT_580641 [Chytriomyces cf. hyalinus JEL632]|nr:hypothetical protein BJ741DRAFT_580641 [Chytriomyces cf. hyalinus JEL632]
MSAAVAYSPHENILRTLPHPPVLGRRIYFCVEEPANIFSAIKCALEHLAQSPKDQITVVSVVQTEAQREVAISTTWSLMKIIEQQTRSHGSNLLLHILLAPPGSFAKLACESFQLLHQEFEMSSGDKAVDFSRAQFLENAFLFSSCYMALCILFCASYRLSFLENKKYALATTSFICWSVREHVAEFHFTLELFR